MAEYRVGGQIKPEIASHLVQAMGSQELPAPATLSVTPDLQQGRQWPDGTGKHRHPPDRAQSHGRVGQQAAVTAVHRTSRPQMPHSS
ncbi:hypothetical protein [Arthrobacter sp. ISL-30]|uniref:hypothetical protein n=1 Tax=Arthrobacter sp. ISL-30 TaxID=2819109 RepID=UPI001BECE5D4|nr:hypothetical protein [Arthrobacter sp. ISL-30]MBT2515403.1 hypothetical protein [Arthrobacter sp. ISL-30]